MRSDIPHRPDSKGTGKGRDGKGQKGDGSSNKQKTGKAKQGPKHA